MICKLNKFLKCESGTQMIEFAFLLPFLILLFAGAVEMGRMFYTYTSLQKATEVGARYLSTSTDSATAKNLIVCGSAGGCTEQSAIAPGLSAANVTTSSIGTGVGTDYKYVTVQVSYAYQPLVFDLGALTGSSQLSLNFTFTPSATMRYMQ